MATLFISVFADANTTTLDKPIQEMVVTVGAGSLKSSAITGTGKFVRRVRLFTDTDCFVAWGSDPTAVGDGTAGMPLGAENPEFVGVRTGDFIAVIERV